MADDATFTPPPGYTWSPNIQKPLPLVPIERGLQKQFPAGNYDFATVPFGDNWVTPTVGAIATVKTTKPGGFSIMARFPYQEPSAGFVMLMRGPYADGALDADRGSWTINTLPGGMRQGRASRPVYGHSGARYDRYFRNGYRWEGEGYYPVPDLSGTQAAYGPVKFATTDRVLLTPCATAPDVTILSSVPNQPVWVAFAVVDMLGRETTISDPVMVDKTAVDGAGSYLLFRRQGPMAHGACGFRIYAGYSATDLHKQPVLNYQGSSDKFLWPLWCQQFALHNIRTDTPAPCPSATVSSLLCCPQQDVLSGKNIINQTQANYDLYCPFLLHYDANNFTREFTGKAIYTHRATWNGMPLETDIPLLVTQNYGDRPKCMSFVSGTALVGVTASDWAGGGAMSNVLERCSFILTGQETYGLLVDERSSVVFGSHTCSEMTMKECAFSATIPVKLEGNQTCKIRFQDNCEFASYSTSTRYPADTVGICYQQAPTTTFFDVVKGVNGSFRSLVCSCGYQDSSNIVVKNLFCDGGCPVYATFAGYAGGTVQFLEGDAINSPGNGPQWARLVEAPVARPALLRVSGMRMTPYVSSVSFMLNQLAIDSDAQFGEVVAPTDASWAAANLSPQYPPGGIDGGVTNPAYFDFSKKPTLKYSSGFGVTPASPVTPVGP